MTAPDCAPVVIAARRTPIDNVGGRLARVPVEELAASVLAALVEDAGVNRKEVTDVILGNCWGPGGNPARVAALTAGLGERVCGLTVDRQCASGLEAILLAADRIRAGTGGVYLAGGVESPSTAPWRVRRPAGPGQLPRFYDRPPFAPAELGDPDMGAAAEAVSQQAGISRERQDAYAAASHARAVAAQQSGRFKAELVPVAGLDHDQRPRSRLTAARLARFPPAFVEGGAVTAGNCCGVSDGAAAVVVTTEKRRWQRGVSGLRLVDWACVGVDPNRPGYGPVPAVRRVLERTGLTVDDLGVVEVTESFAGQVLACLDALQLPEDRVCPDGGAIALGHPWGATGAVLMVRLFTHLVHHAGRRYGLATLGVGGGMGVAVLVERVGGRQQSARSGG